MCLCFCVLDYLCFSQQVGKNGEPIRRQPLQLQSDDGQSQYGALELPELVAGHTVLHLPGPQRRLEARSLLRAGQHQLGMPGHQQAVELRENNKPLNQRRQRHQKT